MSFKLENHQIKAISNMKNGCILCGGVGSGKSVTALTYYFKLNNGEFGMDRFEKMDDNPLDLYIITTAKKRDSKEWEHELTRFLMYPENPYNNVIVVDSWNNIQKYKNVTNSFFVFDEQKVSGYGKWAKTFIKIAKNNQWILLSATPGDKWEDYIPVFIANGFYRNKTDFTSNHCIYSPHTEYPKIERYFNTTRLNRLRNNILVDMPMKRHTKRHNIDVYCDYDIQEYKKIIKNRWNYSKDKPIESPSELCYELRKTLNTHPSRAEKILDLVNDYRRVIIFYNFDYELEILKNLDYVVEGTEAVEVAEWNGHKHQPIPNSVNWVYLVQYTAGQEAWNCILSNCVIFYSMQYSYKTLEQCCGRIDRMNTMYFDLYYYHLKSKGHIDVSMERAIKSKKKFNERKYGEHFFSNKELIL